VLPLGHLLAAPRFWVFAGGGAHGAVQLGSLQAVRETDLQPDQLLGSSAGALTGALYAEDPVAAVNRLTYLWADLDLTNIIGGGWVGMVSPTSFTRSSLADNAGELASLEAVYDARSFADLVLPFGAVATDMISGQPVVFTDGELLPALLASSAIPGVLPPVEINGRSYIDALASANLAASLAMRRGAGSIVAFDTGSTPAKTAGVSLQQLVPAVNALLATQQRLSSLTSAASSVPVIYLPTPGDLPGQLSFKESMTTSRSAYVLARDFLLDLAHEYASTDEALPPGLYARPDAFDLRTEALERVLRPVPDHQRPALGHREGTQAHAEAEALASHVWQSLPGHLGGAHAS
jgi:NTE family protein